MSESITINQLKVANEIRNDFEKSLIAVLNKDFQGDGFSMSIHNIHSIADDPSMRTCKLNVHLRAFDKEWEKTYLIPARELQSRENIVQSLQPIRQWVAENITRELLLQTENQIQEIIRYFR